MFEKILYFRNRYFSWRVISLVIFLFLVIGVPFTVFLAQRSQDVRQRAAELTGQQSPSLEVQNLTNQLLNKVGQGNLDTLSTGSSEETKSFIEEAINIAQKRKALLLDMIKGNPQEFLDNATLADKRDSFPDQVKPYIEEKIQDQGTLTVLHIDNFDEKKSRFEYYIKTTKQYKLYFVNDPPKALTDAKIRVNGIALENNIVLEGSTYGRYTARIIAQATLPPAIGEQKIAVILINFTTDQSQPVTPDYIKQIMFQNTNSKDSIDSFYKENSFNKISFTGDVFGWYTITQPDCSIDAFTNSPLDAATSAGVDTTKYNRFVFVFSNNGGCFNLSGMGTMGGNPSYAWIFSSTSSFVFSHELGHNLVSAHANLLDCKGKSIDDYTNCDNIEYGDRSDVMGTSWSINHFNGPRKLSMGWIPETNIKHITTDGTYTIEQEETASANPQILQIDKTDKDESYFISYKQPIGYDSTIDPGFARGASLHIWNEYKFTQTKLIHANPGTSNYTLLDGSTFFDDINGVEITQVNHSTSSATVAIRLNVDITPSPTPPPPSQEGKIIYTISDYISTNHFVYTIFPDGSNLQRFPVKGNMLPEKAVFSQDGKQIAVVIYKNDTSFIATYTHKGVLLHEFSIPSSWAIRSLFFTPDGKSFIVSEALNLQGSSSIFRVDTNGTNKQTIIQPTTLYTSATAISSDGSKILIETELGAIFLVNVDGTSQEQIDTQGLFAYTPVFSPDNQSIIYSGWGIDGTQDLYKLTIATKSIERIPIEFNGYKTTPSFSPDGKKIVFLSLNSKQALYTVNIDGSSLKQITTMGETSDFNQHAWAVDPDFIQPTSSTTPTLTLTPTPATTCNACSADVNKDGRVSVIDYSLMVTCFDKKATDRCISADINKNGITDIEDFGCVINYFGQTCNQ